MTFNILAIGDICGASGVEILSKRLRGLQRDTGAGFTIVNGENAQGRGLLPADAEAMFSAGADVITLGNHAFSKRGIFDYLDDNSRILRPANYASNTPGRGFGLFPSNYGDIRVIALIGRKSLDYAPENPFNVIDRVLAADTAKFTVVDFHAEATAEKQAMAHYLKGRVSAIWGTHTHVQTADSQVLSGGTGYITDLGMTGPADSVIGMDVEQSISMFKGFPKDHYRSAEGRQTLQGAVFTINRESGFCEAVSAIRLDA
ncbi:MAG: YmdB family metallophosphoesterase [Oscillospiraceae bacterium]|jgi:metallophosphoesterase (TIGR00282 family)|nr:YmdB family metallophosphoesterase [Oscillospiraceae bacterium]